MILDSSNPLLQKIRFEPISTGYFRGAYAVQAQLGITPSTPEQLVELIFHVIRTSGMEKIRRKLFRLTVEGTPSQEVQYSAEALCASLVEYNYQIQIVFNGIDYFRALRGANWVIAKSSSIEIPFGGNEIWYFPPEGKPLVDVVAPIKETTLMYLAPKGLSEGELLEFLARSHYTWNML
jgi:hypothetical protein